MTPASVAILTPYYRPVVGGITSYVDGLVQALQARGVKVSILTRYGAAGQGVESIVGDAKAFVTTAVRRIVQTRPDIVHAHGHWYALEAAIRARESLPSARVVFTFHTPWNALSIRYRAGLLRDVDIVTCPSLVLRDSVQRRVGDNARVAVLHPAVNVVPCSAKDIEAWSESMGIQEDAPVLVFAGPLQYRGKARGVRDLIEAGRRLRRRHRALRVVVVGDGRFRPDLEKYARRRAPGLALFTGSMQPSSLPICRANLYTHISYLEGLPLAVLEAMALGRCVVASRTGGIPEVIDDGTDGVLVNGSVEDLATTLDGLLQNPSRISAIASAAQEKIGRSYTWERRVDDWLHIYRGVST